MKIKIIDNKPLDDFCSDISRYIGECFDVVKESISEKVIIINVDDQELLIFDGEYEVVED